jgi:hypothetical protein
MTSGVDFIDGKLTNKRALEKVEVMVKRLLEQV